MKYTLARRTNQDDKILTYYKTDLQIENEDLNILNNQIKREIREPLGIVGDMKIVLITDMADNTYTVLIIENINAPFIHYLKPYFEV